MADNIVTFITTFITNNPELSYIVGIIMVIAGIIIFDTQTLSSSIVIVSIYLIVIGYTIENDVMDVVNDPKVIYSNDLQNMYKFMQLGTGGISGGLLSYFDESPIGIIGGGVSGAIGITGTIWEAILLN